VIPFPAFVTNPGGNVFDNDERLTDPELPDSSSEPPSAGLDLIGHSLA